MDFQGEQHIYVIYVCTPRKTNARTCKCTQRNGKSFLKAIIFKFHVQFRVCTMMIPHGSFYFCWLFLRDPFLTLLIHIFFNNKKAVLLVLLISRHVASDSALQGKRLQRSSVSSSNLKPSSLATSQVRQKSSACLSDFNGYFP